MKRFVCVAALTLLSACSHAQRTPSETEAAPVAQAPAASDKAAALHAEGVEFLYSKDPLVKNPEKAFQKLSEAAALGDAPSMDLLGGFYAIGVGGVKKDCEKAMDWYEKASEAGYPLAFNNLAYMLVTCEDQKLRDADRAESIMKFLFQNQPNIVALLDTYATVLAEQKDFKQAAKTMEVVIDLQKFIDDNPERIDQAEKTLRLFQRGKRIDGLREKKQK